MGKISYAKSTRNFIKIQPTGIMTEITSRIIILTPPMPGMPPLPRRNSRSMIWKYDREIIQNVELQESTGHQSMQMVHSTVRKKKPFLLSDSGF
jgi:hypothetical protein